MAARTPTSTTATSRIRTGRPRTNAVVDVVKARAKAAS
jgi:hypothetical protein